LGVNGGAVLPFALFVHVFTLRLVDGEIPVEWVMPGNQTP